MRRSLVSVLFLALVLLLPGTADAQSRSGITPEQLQAYTKAYVAIGNIRDKWHAEASQAENKKDEVQKTLHERLRADVQKVISEHGLTDEQYNTITFAISTEPEQRKAFELLMGIAPLAPPPSAAPSVTMSADANNPHIGHVMTSFSSTTNAEGLLPAALAEAKVVATHAGLLARNTSSLDAMKQHAGHVLHAIEPAAGTTGPGTGFGLKKAAASVAQHIELAAKAQGASPAVTTHSVHIATSARNTERRADQIAALAKQIQAATAAPAAAALVAKLTALVEQLVPGADANGDGRIGWEDGEGGLQHVEQHIGLMMR